MFRGFEVPATQFDTKKRTDMIERGRAGRRAERSPDLVQIVDRDAQPGRAGRSVRDRKTSGRQYRRLRLTFQTRHAGHTLLAPEPSGKRSGLETE